MILPSKVCKLMHIKGIVTVLTKGVVIEYIIGLKVTKTA